MGELFFLLWVKITVECPKKINIYGKNKKSVVTEKAGKDLVCMWCLTYTLHSFGAVLNYDLLPAVGYDVLSYQNDVFGNK